MISIEIPEIKKAMNHLLLSPTFDDYLIAEVTITTFNTFLIDGRLQKNFYSSEELENADLNNRTLSYWKDLKPICLELIKGKKTPLNFKMIFELSFNQLEKLLSTQDTALTANDVHCLLMTLKYDGQTLTCVTGTSIKTFTLDKTLEHAWDSYVQKFINSL